MTRDPIGYAGGENLYAYCEQDPTGFTDRGGLAPPDYDAVANQDSEWSLYAEALGAAGTMATPARDAAALYGNSMPGSGLLQGAYGRDNYGSRLTRQRRIAAAGLDVALAMVPFAGRLPNAVGRAGEIAAGILKNAEHIESVCGTARYRVPDVLNHALKQIGDVKNVKYLAFTRQLQDYLAWAKLHRYKMVLHVRRGATISPRILAQEATGAIRIDEF